MEKDHGSEDAYRSHSPIFTFVAYAAAQINAKLSAVAAGSSSEFIKKIDINHLKNRYMLTRGATQQEIGEQTGADVTTRGRYYPEPQKATDSEPPLHLVITAPSQESLDAATAKINELIETAEVPLPTRPQRYEQDRFRHDRESSGGERYGRSNFDRPPRRFHEQRVEVDIIEGPHFNLRAKIVGPQGSFVKYINQTTGCRVQVRGRGSGFIEYDSGVESKEPLYIHISTPREEQLPRAVKMAKDLVATIKNDVENRHASKSATSQQYDQAGGEGQYDYSVKSYGSVAWLILFFFYSPM
ncbi:hypothetical protein DM01DRAFT_261046 [Hesseltinella vesiculosa]|uniref:K Homology domain-containing protein n=1 Tax=Hesseltinella vesiculosa TaxID=101127 RepID=A0A1X2GA72_9FUNG|nr:hypothetical protein DM01DRAFT_261046 [Hesseltinella vesiculosa]